MNNQLKGIMLTLGLSLLLLFAHFGKLIQSPNQYYFSSSGDGFKSYYGALYHASFDSTYVHFEGMNYPVGESVIFTDNLYPLVNPIKFLAKHGVDLRGQLVGIINLSMLAGIVLGAFFLFLLFFDLKLPWWYSAIVAVGVCFLSPQIDRLAGHFTLSYILWIPAILYLLNRFVQTRSFQISLQIGIVVFTASMMHMYFAGFFALLMMFFWLGLWGEDGFSKRSLWNAFAHLGIQYVLPVFLLLFLLHSQDFVNDRPSHPYGFLVYLAHPVSVFLPHGKPWEWVPAYIGVFRHLDWESWAYIGGVATIGTLTGIAIGVGKLLRRHRIEINEKDRVLAFWVLAGIAALLLSFGLPFKAGLESIVEYLGPLKQLRALARFSWLFYYVINILVFTILWRWSDNGRSSKVKTVLIWAALLLLHVEAWYQSHQLSPHLQNKFPALADQQNKEDENAWVEKIDVQKYQAIIPLPYFHVGSENIWIQQGDDALKNCFLVSLKTGLPTTAVMMGRTSIAQTFRNYNLFLEPLNRIEFVDDLSDRRDFLVMKSNDFNPGHSDQRLLDGALYLCSGPDFELYSLSPDSIAVFPKRYADHQKSLLDSLQFTGKGTSLSTDTSAYFFSTTIPMPIRSVEWNTLLDETITEGKEGDQYLLSLWLRHYSDDGAVRFVVEHFQKDEEAKTIGYTYDDIPHYLKALDGDRALFEIPIKLLRDAPPLKISVRNTVLPRKLYIFDQVMIRRDDTHVLQTIGSDRWLDNRPLKAPI
ncbi:hypothetical protein [Mangrovibacterium diazotrophicum]|nr:hypothetical protein [Mangrovibacterium diazotrophicum]